MVWNECVCCCVIEYLKGFSVERMILMIFGGLIGNFIDDWLILLKAFPSFFFISLARVMNYIFWLLVRVTIEMWYIFISPF